MNIHAQRFIHPSPHSHQSSAHAEAVLLWCFLRRSKTSDPYWAEVGVISIKSVGFICQPLMSSFCLPLSWCQETKPSCCLNLNHVEWTKEMHQDKHRLFLKWGKVQIRNLSFWEHFFCLVSFHSLIGKSVFQWKDADLLLEKKKKVWQLQTKSCDVLLINMVSNSSNRKQWI